MRADGACLGLRRGLLGAILLALALGTPAAWAGLQRTLQSRLANFTDSPVTLESSSAKLSATYASPGQFPFATINDTEVRVKRSRVRYVNRLNQQIPTYLVEGKLTLRNRFEKRVDVLELTTTFLNAFREQVGQSHQAVADPMQPYETKTVAWSTTLPHPEVYEIFVALTGVRFHDGTVWAANEEAIVVP